MTRRITLPAARLLLVLALTAVFVAMAAPTAAAHPLGNFTVNQHLAAVVDGDRLRLHHVVDLAEIPTFQARSVMDVDGDGTVDDVELDGYAAGLCPTLLDDVAVTIDGARAALRPESSTAEHRPGEGGLPVTRIECEATGPAPAPGSIVGIVNGAYADSLGWIELVVRGGSGPGVRTESPSAVLTDYPDRGVPLDERTITFTVSSTPSANATAAETPKAGVSAGELTGPGGLVARVLTGATGTGAILLGLAAAFGLGAGHALAPGHGKALMAAYLVGNRGTARHAAGLGLAVAVSHTLGVAVLGLVTLAASAAFRPERIYPYLSAVSAVIILGLGIWLVRRAVLRLRSSDGHRHAAGHDHGHSHHHEHGADGHHHHLPSTGDGEPGGGLGWKSLAALGLSGGLVPSASAVVLFLGALNLGRIDIGLAMVGLFGLGMATSLVLVGIAVVRTERWGRERLRGWSGAARLSRWLPAAAALAVTAVGTVMTVGAIGAL